MRAKVARPSMLDRFHSHYTPVTETGCWLWTAASFADGYGVFTAAKKTRRAHRFSWEVHVGDIPSGMLVCHKCDTPTCVNPDHLFLGSVQDNSDDKVRKRRHAVGETQGNAKLTRARVLSILQDDRPCSAIASDYGCSIAAIQHVRDGRTWKSVIYEREQIADAAPTTDTYYGD